MRLFLGWFADHRLGKGVAKFDFGGHFNLGEPTLEVPADLVGGDHRSRLQLDESLGRFAPVLVIDADHRHFLDGAVLVDRLLDAAGVDVVARADDEVLDAVDDENKTIPSSMTPTSPVRRKSPDELIGRLLGFAPIAPHHLGPLTQISPFSPIPTCLLGVGRVAQGDDGAGQWLAN